MILYLTQRPYRKVKNITDVGREEDRRYPSISDQYYMVYDKGSRTLKRSR